MCERERERESTSNKPGGGWGGGQAEIGGAIHLLGTVTTGLKWQNVNEMNDEKKESERNKREGRKVS